MEKVKLGIVGFTDKGDWVSGYKYNKASTGETVTGYNVNDLVHTANGIYCSKKAGNTSNPDNDSVNWKAWIDLKQYMTAQANETARQNAEAARAKAEESRKAAESNRADAETKRTQTETDRITHESQREEAETQRKANDTQRTADDQAIYDGLQAKSAETDRLLVEHKKQGSVEPMTSIHARIANDAEVTEHAGATINEEPKVVQPSPAHRTLN